MKTTSIITTLRARVAMTLLLAITTFTGAWASQFITDVVLIGGSKSEVNNLKAAYQSKGWTVIDKDLNDGCGSTSDYIYLLYKKADNFENSPNLTFITGFYLTNESGHLSEDRNFNGLPYHLVPYDGGSHFKSVQGNLNSNCIATSRQLGGLRPQRRLREIIRLHLHALPFYQVELLEHHNKQRFFTVPHHWL